MSLRFGLLGYPLGHSRSPEIHAMIYRELGIDARYELFETPPARLAETFERLIAIGVRGVNVTIPHKLAVMPLLDRVDREAKAIGAVNTVNFRKDGVFGSNTDAEGFRQELVSLGIRSRGKTAVILGHGGAFRPVCHVLRKAGAVRVIAVGRDQSRVDTAVEGTGAEAITFASAESRGLSGDILVNCTPVGTTPNVDDCPVPPEFISRFEAVVDLIYNPAETRLVSIARERGILAANGLYMLVAQAVRSVSSWIEKPIGQDLVERVYVQAMSSFVNGPREKHSPEDAEKGPPGFVALSPREKRIEDRGVAIKGGAIYLTGMPGSGKTTIGRIIARKLDIEFVDLDRLIERREGKTVSELFEESEEAFRNAESAALESAAFEASRGSGLRAIVATGGGAVLRGRNLLTMKKSGTIVFIDRPLAAIVGDIDRTSRPLLRGSDERIYWLYDERYPIYRSTCDIRVQNEVSAEETARAVISSIGR